MQGVIKTMTPCAFVLLGCPAVLISLLDYVDLFNKINFVKPTSEMFINEMLLP